MKNRRELLQSGAATLAAVSLANSAFAQGAGGQAAPPPRNGKFPLDAYSRNLQWCRTPQELTKAITDLGQSSVDLTVAAYPGHVDPAKVKTDLPSFANALKQGGINVSAITCAITDADSPNAEAILDAAASAGIHYYSWGGFTYDQSQPYAKQLDALKPRIAKLVKLNQKYGAKALYQPRAGANNVGSVFVDFLEVLQNFDPKFVAFRYDTGALLQASPQSTVTHLRLGAPYIGGVALNDAAVTLDLPVWEEGAFDDDPKMLTLPSGGGDNSGNAGGDPMAIGGGGNPLPYHIHPVQVGTGQIDLVGLGKVLKEINFNGPAECQVLWPLGGVEAGSDKINLPRQQVLGLIKRDRLIVEQGFRASWNIDVALPPFMEARENPGAVPAGGRGGRGGRGGGAAGGGAAGGGAAGGGGAPEGPPGN